MTPSGSLSPGAAVTFGIANLATAALIAFGVFACLPDRWWPVDVPAGLLAGLELASGVGLLLRTPWAVRASRLASGVALVLGLATVTLLALTASWLSGVYGPVGKGGGLVLALVAALALPYTVALPAIELVWMRRGADGPK